MNAIAKGTWKGTWKGEEYLRSYWVSENMDSSEAQLHMRSFTCATAVLLDRQDVDRSLSFGLTAWMFRGGDLTF